MRTLEAISISKTIVDNVEVRIEDVATEMAKNGYVNVDGIMKQYNPMTFTFVDVNDNELKQYIDYSIPNKWALFTAKSIKDSFLEQLPQLSEKEILNFTAYMKAYQTVINDNLIKTGIDTALKDYKQYDGLEVKINNGHDITNQLIVMKQNRIFTDMKLHKLFKFRAGQFQIYNLNDVLGLFRTHLAAEDVQMKTSDVQRNFRTYLTSLTDIHKIRVELRQKEKKETTLRNYESDYKTVLKLLKEY